MSDKEIEKICDKYNITNYTIKDGLVNVIGDVDLYRKRLTDLPLKFGDVTGSFNCSENKLTSLEGSPSYVGDSFDCSGNELTTLQGCPTYVGDFFNCGYNQLTDLKVCPDEVEGYFYCNSNKIYSLDGLLFKRINIRWMHNNPIINLYNKYNLGDIDHREFLIEADVIRPPDVKGGKPIINKDRMDWFTQTYDLEEFTGNKNYILEL